MQFDDTVPTKLIELKLLEFEGDDTEQYEVICHKETHRLTQNPGSYTVIIYKLTVVRHKNEQSLSVHPPSDSALNDFFANVFVIDGIMVDKEVYHFPLYNQHQRMLDNGVQVRLVTLINWVKRGIELLTYNQSSYAKKYPK